MALAACAASRSLNVDRPATGHSTQQSGSLLRKWLPWGLPPLRPTVIGKEERSSGACHRGPLGGPQRRPRGPRKLNEPQWGASPASFCPMPIWSRLGKPSTYGTKPTATFRPSGPFCAGSSPRFLGEAEAKRQAFPPRGGKRPAERLVSFSWRTSSERLALPFVGILGGCWHLARR